MGDGGVGAVCAASVDKGLGGFVFVRGTDLEGRRRFVSRRPLWGLMLALLRLEGEGEETVKIALGGERGRDYV